VVHRIRLRRDRGHGRESGVALVELALCLPFLAIIAFGTIDLGRAYLTWVQVKNAAREGANYAQTHPYLQKPVGSDCPDPDNIQYRARLESTGATVAVSPNTPDGTGCDLDSPSPGAGTSVTVTVSRPFTIFTPLVSAVTGSITVRASVTEAVQG
jgi:Flp pilus assembly protein TadG